MNNFNFYNPTRIFFGKNQFENIDLEIPKNAKVMITFGRQSAKKSGLIDKITNILGKRQVIEFAGIEPNPKYETLMKATEIIKAENVDFILAVGGGSVIDGTKFISLATYYDKGEAADLLFKYQFEKITSDIVRKTVPFGSVLTLPATGSEMNCGAVISYNHGKFSLRSEMIFPKFSILDPTTTFSLPKIQVANGIIDTFIHTTEQYITFPVDARLQDRISEGILKTLIEIGQTTINEPENYDARANLMWCSTMALNGIIAAGVPQDWATHMIGHELTAMFGIDHAQTLAIIFPSLVNVQRKQKHAKLLQFAERVWNIKSGTADEKIDLAIQKTHDFFESLGIKTKLSEYGISADKAAAIVDKLENHGFTKLSETGDITLEVSRKIIENAM